jgi:RHS repeat-associated protein
MAPEEYDSYCLDGQEQFTNLYPFNPSGSTNWSVNAGEWEYADETSTVFSPNFYITIDTIFIELTECPGGAQHVFIVKVTAPTQDGYIYDLSGNLIQDLNEGLVTSWNPQGKVAEVTFDQKEESSQVYHGNNIEVPSGFPNPQTYTYPCGPGTSSTATFQFQTFTNGKLSFEYDPMGERMIKEKKIINEYCITCFGATNSGVCFEPVESQSFDLYIRDAQGNVIAMYALDTNMEAIDHYEFYSEFLNNAEDADGLDYSDLRTGFFDNLAVTDGKFLDLAKEYSGVSDAALLARMDIEEILDDNPQLLSQLMSGYGDIHLSGFFNDANYTSWLKTQIRNTSAYQNYAQTKAEELADIDMEDELLAYAGYRGDMANDAQTLHNRLMTCVQNNQPNCDADIDCYNCEADLLNDDVAAYDLCISNLGCDPNNYCTDCDREYSDYRAVGDLLRVPYDYDQLVDAYYLELTTPGGIGDNLEHFFNTGVSPATPLSHTTQTMNGAVITGSANFRTYLDDYYDNNPWESQITSLISTDALVQDYFVAHLSTLVYNDVLNKAAINSGESGYTDEQYLAYMLDEERSSYSITNFLDGIASTFGPEKPGLLLHVQDSPYYVAYPEKHGLLPDSPGDMLVYTIEPKEYYIYGSSRLGSLKHYNAKPDANTNLNKLGHKSYELTDHLGNVHATVSDRKLVADTDQDGTPDAFVADLQTSNDYFPYGMLIPSRSYNYNPMELVNDFDTVQRTVTTENLTTNITPDFSGGELASGAGLWEAVLYADNGSLLATHTESYSGWYLGGNNVEMILHENDAQRVILKRHINTNELSTLNANDRIEVSFRLAKNDTNLLSTQSPNLSATWRLRNNTSGQVEQSGSISFPYNNGYKTVIIAFIANASDYTIEVEYEFVQKTMHYTHPIRVAAMRLFNLRHYDISTNTFNEVVNNQYERQGIYRYGFQGQERDDEISGIGNSYTANFWQYDPRLGRRWNIDPVFKSHESPYASIANNPVWLIDPNGADTTINGKPNFDGLNLSDGETVTFVYMGKRGPGNYTDGLDRESFIYHAGNENFEAGFYSPSDYAYVHLDYDNNQVMPPMNYLEWTLFEGQDRFISGVDGKEYEVDRNGYLTGEERPIVLDPFIFFGGPGRKGVQIIAAGYRANKLYAVSRTIISIVKQDETLLKFARQTFQGNNQLRTEANSLLQQLKLGNLNPGIGTKNIGKNIFEARSRGGARVYFRNSSDGLEILGYSSKSNQQKVINRLLETY